jgi:hypothetical protein
MFLLLSCGGPEVQIRATRVPTISHVAAAGALGAG